MRNFINQASEQSLKQNNFFFSREIQDRKLAKMQNSSFKFHLNSFQSFNFIFIQLSPLISFKYVQLRLSSTSVKCLPLKCPILIFFDKKITFWKIKRKRTNLVFPNWPGEETSVTQYKKYTSSLPLPPFSSIYTSSSIPL